MTIPDHNVEPMQTAQEWTPERVALTGRNMLLIAVGGVAFGLFAAAVQFYWISAIIACALVTMLVAWKFEAALAVYALVAFVPWGGTPDLAVGGSGVGKGVYVSEIMLGYLLLVWFGKYLLGALPRNRISSGFYIPLALYLAYCVLNVVNSYLFWDPHVNRMYQHPIVNVIELCLRFLSAGALVMIATTISDRKWLVWITYALFVPGIYNALNAATGSNIPISAPFWALLTLLPTAYATALALRPDQPIARRALAGGGVILMVITLFTVSITWVSGWFGLLTAVGTVLFVAGKRFFFAFTIVSCLMAALGWSYLHSNVVTKSRTEGDYDRFALLAGSLRYASTFPLGVGLGNYRTYNSFHYGEKWGTTSYTSAHGTYAQHLSETGFAGFALFIILLASGFVFIRRSYQEMRPGLSRMFLLAAMGQLVGVACAALIGDYIVPTYHNNGLMSFSGTIYSWLVWGLAIAHVRLYQEHEHCREEAK